MLSTDGTTPRSIGFCGNSSSYGGRVLVVACDSMRRTDLHHRPLDVDLPGEGREDHHNCIGDDYDDDDDLHTVHGVIVSTAARGRDYRVGGERERHRFSYEFFTPAATVASSSRSFVTSPLTRETPVADGPVAIGIVRPVSHASTDDRSQNDIDGSDVGRRSRSPLRRTDDHNGNAAADEAVDSGGSGSGGGGRGRRSSSAAQKLEELFSPPQASETDERNGTLVTTNEPADGSGTATDVTDDRRGGEVGDGDTSRREDGDKRSADEGAADYVGDDGLVRSKPISKTSKSKKSPTVVDAFCCVGWPSQHSGSTSESTPMESPSHDPNVAHC